MVHRGLEWNWRARPNREHCAAFPRGDKFKAGSMAVVSRLAQRRLATGIAAASLLFQSVMSCLHIASNVAAPWVVSEESVQKPGSLNLGPGALTLGLFVCSAIGVKRVSPDGGGSKAPGRDRGGNCPFCLTFSKMPPGAPVSASGPGLFFARVEGAFAIPRSGSVPGGLPVAFVNSRGPPRASA
jgi:hypothetical protein